MLTDRITLSSVAVLEPEDYFSSSLGVIFPDDITNQHGDPSTPVIYTSPRFGNIFLSLAEPVGEGSRRLFAQYLWNAGVLMAVGIEDAAIAAGNGMGGTEVAREDGKNDPWDVRGEAVLELGAGTGLAGIVAVKVGAAEVLLTDYPAEEVLANLRANVERNLGAGERSRCRVRGHEWGKVPGFEASESFGGVVGNANGSMSEDSARSDVQLGMGWRGETGRKMSAHTEMHKIFSETDIASTFPATNTESTSSNGSSSPFPPSIPTTQNHHHQSFTRILLADCLWMPDQHAALHRSISHFLTPGAHDHGRVLVVAGFHTGRAKMAPFFDAHALAAHGLEVESITERDAMGAERDWVVDCGVEDVTQCKRWLVVAVLRPRLEEARSACSTMVNEKEKC